MKSVLTNKLVNLLKSLKLKKFRDQHNLFIAEGVKINNEILHILTPKYVIGVSGALTKIVSDRIHKDCEIIEVNDMQMSKLTLQKTPQGVICIYEKPSKKEVQISENELILMLDDVQDPGNLGTIIRLATWFGIKHLICSKKSSDAYSPKVVQSTMGALVKVNIVYCDLVDFLENHDHFIKYGTFLEGENIYSSKLSEGGIIIMGNEGNGISSEIEKKINRKIFIPPYPSIHKSVESLNVSIATSIICSEFRRRLL